MKIFVIHRFKDRKQANAKLKKLAKQKFFDLQPIFLDSSGSERWKEKALKAIQEAEAVIVFDRKSCEESDNAKWEIKKADEVGKTLIEIDLNNEDKDSSERLKSVYDFKEEFDSCFSSNKEKYFELYKLMVDSSESLIQRRQKTNAFFITVIGSLLAIAGFFVKTGAISGSVEILYGFSVVGCLLCYSWRNLIDNYGKLNKAKFDVILRMEKEFGAQIYSAEWIALGKGMRRKKYKSFTSTEKNVPLYFGLLIIVLTLIAVGWQIWG